jgi:hypothetical protein
MSYRRVPRREHHLQSHRNLLHTQSVRRISNSTRPCAVVNTIEAAPVTHVRVRQTFSNNLAADSDLFVLSAESDLSHGEGSLSVRPVWLTWHLRSTDARKFRSTKAAIRESQPRSPSSHRLQNRFAKKTDTCSEMLSDSEYQIFHGTPLFTNGCDGPDRTALLLRWELFSDRHSSPMDVLLRHRALANSH